MKNLVCLIGLGLLSSCQSSLVCETPENVNYDVLCYGRHAPERQDDFTWENDRIAFRMYGPECGKTGTVLSGIDIWAKKVETPIIDLWYARNDAGENYHTDRGEGADFYKVGKTLGAGGLGFLADGKLYCTQYWEKSRILEQGPNRIVFELDFPELKVGKSLIKETKRITLERGSNFNKIECSFEITGAEEITVAAGLRKSHNKAAESTKLKNAYACSEVVDKKQVIYSAIQVKDQEVEHLEAHDHYLLTAKIKKGEGFTYYAGAAWQASGQFKDFNEWIDTIK